MTSNTTVDHTECLYVEKDSSGIVVRCIKTLSLPKRSRDHVRIKVEYSSLNYKDALCATGHPGVARTLPIVPGIDAAGVVLESGNATFSPGDAVMVFHADFGTKENGALSQIIDVPTDWVYPIPQNLDARQVMAIGTAGFTAAQCVDELIKHGVTPDKGEVVVTGATGGVGVFSLAILSKLGYTAVASTGKLEREDWLRKFGASSVLDRKLIVDDTDRPLLSGRWAGAVDAVGGATLASIIRGTKPYGCVTACGLVGGTDLALSVYPFILRGVTLQGVDTAGIPREYRSKIWDRISNEWSIESLEDLVIEVDLTGVEEKIQQLLAGQITGRVIVNLS